MTEPLDILYHKQMLALTQNPVFFMDNLNKNKLDNPVCLNNPLCGDALCFGFYQNNIYWYGEGCLICLASAEALCQTVKNIDDTSKIKSLCMQIQDYFNGICDRIPHDFLPLSSVKQVKSRIKCVILSTHCVINLIKGS